MLTCTDTDIRHTEATPTGLRPAGGSDVSHPQVIADRYEILGLYGRGGMGSVYRARDRVLDEPIALKLLHRELSGDAEALARFRHEVRLARRVTHRNVARTFDFGEHGELAYLTMEAIEGDSLAELLARAGRLPAPRAVAIAIDVAAGLAAAHTAGVVHRDLKPDNVLIAGDDERVVITDFGIAVASEAFGGARRRRRIVGTPAYMAPEQLVSPDAIDARVDVYALGLVLYEMLVGELPWPGATELTVASARLVAPPRDPRDVCPELPGDLVELVLACLAARPDERIPSVEAVATRLTTLECAPSPAPGPRNSPATTERIHAEARAVYHDFWRTAESVALFERALAQSPHDARILAGSSLALSRATGMDVDTVAARRSARERATLATRLAPSVAEPHVALGVVYLHDGDLVGAASHLRRALDLSPDQIDALEHSARMLLETRALEAGIARAERAGSLEAQIRAALKPEILRAHALLGRWDEVERDLRQRPPSGAARMSYWLGRIRLALWRNDPEHKRQVSAELAEDSFPHKTFPLLYARFLGPDLPGPLERQFIEDRAESTTCSSRQRAFFHQLAAEVHARLGDADRALDAVAAALSHGLFDEAWLARCPALDTIRTEPRFRQLGDEVGRRASVVETTLLRGT